MKKFLTTLITIKAVDKMSGVVNKAFGNAQGKLNRIARTSARVANQASAFSASAGVAALGLAAALAVPVNKAIEFEQAIADVGAVSRASASEMVAMGKRAREMGSTTQFTAVESAKAMGFLAMAGFNTNQAISALPNTLNLSAAGAVDLARAADISSNILSGFNLKVSDLARMNDVLVNTFTSSNTTLDMLGETMKFAAPIAASLGEDIAVVAAMAGKLGDAGIQSTMAGTSLRTMMLRLSAPMRRGAKALAELGVNTKDAEGNLRNMPSLLAELGTKINRLPTGKQAELVKNIFGTEAASAAMILLNQARTNSLQDYIATLQKAGSAQEAANRRMSTSQGAMLRLKSAAEELAIVTGNALLPILADAAEKAAAVANRIGKWAEANPKLFRTIIKVVAAATAIIGTLAVVGTVVAAVSSAVSFLATAFSVLGSIAAVVAGAISLPFLAVVAAIAGIAFTIYQKWDEIVASFARIKAHFKEGGMGIVKGIFEGILLGLKTFPLTAPIFDAVKYIRELLPFSPAKRGPLRDIHRIKLVETIAGSIKPAPLVGAMSGVIGTVANMGRPASSGAVPVASSRSSFNAPINVTFNGPVSESDKQSFTELLQRHKAELARMMDSISNDRTRLAY